MTELPAEARQFDFWIGEWDLSWGEAGRGSNSVHAILDGRVIQEQFDGAPAIALRGMSLSVYNQQRGLWQQTWVDNSGAYLDFEGGMRDGAMILEREALIDGRPMLQRMVWFNIREDGLDWNWERSADGGRTWETLWAVRYQRREGTSYGS